MIVRDPKQTCPVVTTDDLSAAPNPINISETATNTYIPNP